MPTAGNYFLSCDWGTSSFRLVLADRKVGRPLELRSSDDGIAATYTGWKEQGGDRIGFYLEVIRRQLSSLSGSVSFSLEELPIIISGMASSSIGIEELPYAGLPFALDGTGVITRKIVASQTLQNDIILVSGLRSDADVMRGEETQLLGLAPSFPDEATFIFPGTHSKHILVSEGNITGFETYMTGELFHLLSVHSVLKDSVEQPVGVEMSVSDREAFHTGLRQAETAGLLRSAFLVRTNYLFQKIDKVPNFHYLSGLLIGAELKHLKGSRFGRSSIVLCAGEVFSGLYYEALSAFGIADRVHHVPASQVEHAALNGHRRLLERF